MKLALADRDVYYGDPLFEFVPFLTATLVLKNGKPVPAISVAGFESYSLNWKA